MARARKQVTFDELPLFAVDAELATAIVGTDPLKRAMWLASLPALEKRGFPRVTVGFGRYKPAVLKFYDQFYAITDADGREDKGELGPWTRRRKPSFFRPGIDKK